MKTSRRIFLMTLASTGAVLGTVAHAQAKVDEKDPRAVALGYVSDSAKADAKKYPAHTAAQTCSNCALFQGKPSDAAGPCPLFAPNLVSAKGWCSAWAKKA